MNYLMTLDSNLVEDIIKPHVINKRREIAATTIQKYYRRHILVEVLQEQYDDYLDNTLYDLKNAGFEFLVSDITPKIGYDEDKLLNSITFRSTEKEWLCINRVFDNTFNVSGHIDDEDINDYLNNYEEEVYEKIVYLRYDHDYWTEEYIIYGIGDNNQTIDEWLKDRKIVMPVLVKSRDFAKVSYRSAWQMIEERI